MKKPPIEKIEKILLDYYGNILVCAKNMGVRRETLYQWIRSSERLKKAVVAGREAMIDFTESNLFKNIAKGKEASIFFYLKTQGKKRGYIEKQEIVLPDGVKLNITDPEAEMKKRGIPIPVVGNEDVVE